MSTTQEQIEGVRALCRILEAMPEVKRAYPDDWGRYGNFQVLVTPARADRYTTQRMKGWLSKAIRQAGCTAKVRQVFAPDPVVERSCEGRPKVRGYRRDYWTVDLDYMKYDPQSNSFS